MKWWKSILINDTENHIRGDNLMGNNEVKIYYLYKLCFRIIIGGHYLPPDLQTTNTLVREGTAYILVHNRFLSSIYLSDVALYVSLNAYWCKNEDKKKMLTKSVCAWVGDSGGG